MYVAMRTVFISHGGENPTTAGPLGTALFLALFFQRSRHARVGSSSGSGVSLRRPLFFGDMTQVDADACPCG